MIIKLIAFIHLIHNIFAEYSVLYDLSLNKKIQGSVNEDQYHYYSLTIRNSNKKYLYLTLSKLVGNANLFVNFITDEAPTIEKSDFKSVTPNDEFLEVNLLDQNYKQKKRGEKHMIIGVYGFFNSTYSLYATTHSQALYPVSDRASCKTKKSQYCYFSFSAIQPAKDLKVLIAANFIYGSGDIYSKLHSARELNKTVDYESLTKVKKFDVDSKHEGYDNSLLVYGK